MINQQKKDIPPGLLRIVKASKPSKKFFILLGISLFLVISGFGAVYFFNEQLGIGQNLKIEKKISELQTHNNLPISQQSVAQKPEKEAFKEPDKVEKPNLPKVTEVKDLKENQKKMETTKTAKKLEKNEGHKIEELYAGSLETYKGADFLYRAQDFEQKGLLADAINEYKEYINYTGKANEKILNKIAILYFLSGHLKEADHYAELAYNSNKNSKEILLNYGVIKAKLGEIDKAEESFNKIIRNDPNNRNALYNLALLKEQKGEYKEAFRLYQKLYELGDLSVVSSIERLKNK